LPANPEAMSSIQQQLLRDDAFLIGRCNNDALDLARKARVTTSSEQLGGEAENIVTGQTRAVHGDRGAPPDRTVPGSHRWMSDPAQTLPAWIQLAWDSPQAIKAVQLIFDTGLHRHLTLSHHDGYTARMQWGVPQPETVKDYTIEAYEGNNWIVMVSVTGNYQRRRSHTFTKEVVASVLRITVKTTNGMDHARVCEVRVSSTG
jgi:hypothetical protein